MIGLAVKYNTLRGAGFLNLFTEKSIMKYQMKKSFQVY